MKNLMLISNSTRPGEPFLSWPLPHLLEFFSGVKGKGAFIPYAAVTLTYNEYEDKVKERFLGMGLEIESVHQSTDPARALEQAAFIVVGGGNTFCLIKALQDNKLLNIIYSKTLSGTPYLGWSAGANLACPTIRTTNDMPIVDIESTRALNLVPFQINPHYIDVYPEGHGGETREMRIREFTRANPGTRVLGLREGTLVLARGEHAMLKGEDGARLFHEGHDPVELVPGDVSFLLAP